jgi:acetolactate synthase small subunit
MQQQTFEIRAKDAPGLMARLETILRRQRVAIRSFSFEGGEGGGPARIDLVIEADEERSSLVERQFMRLEDVTEVVRNSGTAAFAQPTFTFEERTA